MRARNLKPALFKNEILGTSDPLYTILFEGLWCLADRAGRLEDRALRIKAEVLPYRDGVDVDALLNWLHANNFIFRYEACGKKVIQVMAFLEHQNPHRNEVPSELPELDAMTSDQGRKSLQPRPVPLGLIPSSLTPDSGFLTPDSRALDSTTKDVSTSTQGQNSTRGTNLNQAGAGADTKSTPPDPAPTPKGSLPNSLGRAESEAEISAHILEIKADWPRGCPHEDWITAEKCIRNLALAGESWNEIKGGTARYGKFCKATNRLVANPGRWYADSIGRPWRSPWTIPPKRGEQPAPDHTAEWAEAKCAAKAIHFRDPFPEESAKVYATAVKMAMNVKPMVPLAERRGLAGVKRVAK